MLIMLGGVVSMSNKHLCANQLSVKLCSSHGSFVCAQSMSMPCLAKARMAEPAALVQVASHAQKYFIRLNSMNKKDKRRSSIHDITSVNPPTGDMAGATHLLSYLLAVLDASQDFEIQGVIAVNNVSASIRHVVA